MDQIIKVHTHGGVFHADDVFSTALLKLVFHEISLTRGTQIPEDADIVYDIGGGEFDHHGPDREAREDGTLYASFGKLWRRYGPELVSPYVWQKLDSELVKTIDHCDNCADKNLLSTAIAQFNPAWDEDDSGLFQKAVIMALEILKRTIHRTEAEEKAMTVVGEALAKADDGIVVLDQYLPWKTVLRQEGSMAKIVIFPGQRGGFSAQRVWDEEAFPATWRGKAEDPTLMAEIGLTFCHAGGFLAVFQTLPQAISACKACLAQEGI